MGVVPVEDRRGHKTPAYGVKEACMMTFRSQRQNLGLLQEQQLLLMTEPHFQEYLMRPFVSMFLSEMWFCSFDWFWYRYNIGFVECIQKHFLFT